MYKSLDLFRVSSAMASHAGARVALTATNVANADTPGYRATGLPPFAEAYRDMGPSAMRTTRPGHLIGPQDGASAKPQEIGSEPSPNGNTVSIEHQMLQSIEAQREHSRALAIYRHALGVIRTTLGQ